LLSKIAFKPEDAIPTIIVECSNGHRFPVNLEKHIDRDYVFCPKCREQVKVRKEHFFSPNPKWMKEKEERESEKKQMRLMKKKRESIPMFETVGSPVLGEMARAIFEASKVMKEKKKEEVKKEDEQREGTTD